MNITEAEVQHLTKVMEDAKAALKRMKQQNEIIVKMLVEETKAHTALRAWIGTRKGAWQ